MNKKLIVLIVAVLAIAIVIGFAIPALLNQAPQMASAGSEIFGNGTGTSPPPLP